MSKKSCSACCLRACCLRACCLRACCLRACCLRAGEKGAEEGDAGDNDNDDERDDASSHDASSHDADLPLGDDGLPLGHGGASHSDCASSHDGASSHDDDLPLGDDDRSLGHDGASQSDGASSHDDTSSHDDDLPRGDDDPPVGHDSASHSDGASSPDGAGAKAKSMLAARKKWGCLGQGDEGKQKAAQELKPIRGKRVDRPGLQAPAKAALGKAKPFAAPAQQRVPSFFLPKKAPAPIRGGGGDSSASSSDDDDGEEAENDDATGARGLLQRDTNGNGRIWKFSEEWKKEREWLHHAVVGGFGRMWCTICVAFYAQFSAFESYKKFTGRTYRASPWEDRNKGCRTIRPTSLTEHEKAKSSHDFAVHTRRGDGESASAAAGSSGAGPPSMAQPSLRTREAVAVPADTTDENRPFFAMFQNAYIIADNNISAKVFPAFNDSDHRKGTPTIQRQAPLERFLSALYF